MTEDEIIAIVTKGTTQRGKGKVKCLYVDEKFTLVKWPGEVIGNSVFYDYVSSWVNRYEIEDLKAAKTHPMGKEVWCCERGKDGPLTKKRLALLIEQEKGN